MGEHLPCKQGVKSSNLSVSIVDVIKLLQSTLYLENRIKTKTIKDQKEIKTSEVTRVTRYRDISKQTRDLNM